MKHFLRFLILATVACQVSCDSSDDGKALDYGKAYFPTRVGAYLVYDVTETTYTLSQPSTQNYQLKIAIIDKFLSTDGDSTFVIHRSKRNTDIDAWSYIDTWSVRSNSREVVTDEENIAYVKLKFPVANNSTWDGNVYNTLGEDEYEMSDVKTAQTFNEKTFNDCITVIQNDNQDYIVYLDQRKEVYAAQVGLVYKETTQLKYCTQDNCLGQQQVESGIIYKQTISTYGVE
ncbi:MAG TPA: hypothetical protein VIN08_00370 [Ohtaekwangia sp.]|uniref:hypothetical protein n=1 Tax=Ohtaekwangia sp. TaxID=2066019 RepID=UPI002F94D68B